MNHLTYRLKGIFLLFLLSTVTLFGQQTRVLTGRVLDAKTQETLPFATIQLEGSVTGTVTDLNGAFTLGNIRNSSVNITVSFLGYESKVVPCNFGNRNTLDITVRLNPSSTRLDEVRVLGQAEGQSKAFLDQRVAVNIKNIVSAEQILKFPDVNAAEVMQRIPGITLQRDQGEGRYVQLRGTPPELTNFNINGEQIPSPEGGVRYVGLDVIAADQIEFIEVTKVLTPDMDADGIAGNVNIITKSAQDSTPSISASLAGGYNNLLGTDNEQIQFSYGQRLNKFGFQMNASYYNNNQASHNMEYDYSRGPVLSQAQGDSASGAENFHILYEDVEFRYYIVNRKRTGLSANFDYRLNDRNLIYFRAMFNQFADNEVRHRMTHSLSDANTLLEYRESGIDRNVRDRLQVQEITTFNLGGEHTLFLGSTLDYEVSYGVATEDTPNYFYANFDQGGIDVHIDKTDPIWPRVVYVDDQDRADAENYADYEFDEITMNSSAVLDINKTAKLNFKLPYILGKNQGGYIKLGGKVRIKSKERDTEAKVYNRYNERVPIYSQVGPPLNLTTIEDDFEESDFLDHGYELNHMVDPEKMRKFFEEHPQNFRFDEQDTWEDTYQEDYSVSEAIYAGYFMVRHDIGKIMILGGLRFEQTDLEYTAQDAWTNYEAGGILEKGFKTDARTKRFLLPQFQLKYSINEMTNLRAALTYSYSRPNFDDIVPYRQVSDNGDIDKGNPTLDYPYSMNIDLLAERYLPGNGILSGGLFYKKIDNFIFNYVRRAHEGDDFNLYGLREITMAVNGIEAFVYGAEIQAQVKFNKLPWILKNLGLYTTYTFTESDAYISKRFPQNEKDVVFEFDDYGSDFFTNSDETEVIPLPGQAKHTVNLSLFYESAKLYLKLSSNFHTSFLDELGNDSGLDVYYGYSFHLDFTANYQISDRLNAFIDLINLTNAPLRYYMGSWDYFKQQEFYSWGARAGIKLNF